MGEMVSGKGSRKSGRDGERRGEKGWREGQARRKSGRDGERKGEKEEWERW